MQFQRGFAPLLVILIAAALAAGGFFFYNQADMFMSSVTGSATLGTYYATQQACEQVTGRTCDSPMCDYNCPSGYKKGWWTMTAAATSTASTTVDTSTWETYRNEKYGFEFQYPSHLFLKEGEKVVCIDEKSGDTDAPSTCFWEPQIADVSLEVAGKQLFPDLKQVKHPNINGDTALAFQSGPDAFPANEIIFQHNDRLYRIGANSSYSEPIISTLKFTN